MKKIFLGVFIAMFGVIFSQSVPENYAYNQLLVQFFSNQNTELASNIEIVNTKLLSKQLNIYLIDFEINSTTITEILEKVKSSTNVKNAQLNHYVKPRQIIPNDPLFNQQWALKNINNCDIKATHAWEETTGGQTVNNVNIIVAVIDTGFDLNHDDICYYRNINENRYNRIDDDENGYIDDYYGWNAYNHSGVIQPTSHGTHVSGIIGARGNNNLGVSGVNWNVKILPIMGASELESVVIEAYNYALTTRTLYNQSNGTQGAYIVCVNSSFGVNRANITQYPLWNEMFNSLGQQGVLNVASTANENYNVDIVGDMPSNCNSNYLITVTNTTEDDERYITAGFGATSVDLSAPGTNILSTTINDSYNTMTGTSMSAAFVSGAIALLYSAAPASFLEFASLSPAQAALKVKTSILQGIDTIPALQDITTTGGRLNVNRSLTHFIESVSTTHSNNSNNLAKIKSGNYPNPFNPNTTLWFSIPNTQKAKLTIHNVKGQKVKTVFNAVAKKGKNLFTWNGTDDKNNRLSSGIYFYKLKTKNFTKTQKILLIK